MATPYNDIYVRDNFGDNGSIPSVGNPYASPDIIPLQSGSLPFAQAVSTYPGPQDLGMQIVSDGVNNIYIRAKNNGTAASSATATLAYSSSNLFLLPNTWNWISTPAGSGVATMLDGNQSPTIAAGGICLSSPAFLLTDIPPLTDGQHYCMISVLQTPSHPVVVPTSFPSNAAIVQWVQNNPAVGWRNINYVPNGQSQLIVTHGFSNITASNWIFECKGFGFATNSPITVQSTDARCPIQQSGVLPAGDPTGAQTFVFEQYVPSNLIESSVVVTVSAPAGQTIPPGSILKVTAYQIPSNDALEQEVAALYAVGRGHTQPLVDGMVSLIKLGESTTVIAS